MRACIAFVKKEFLEYARTYKLLIVTAVFLLFGMLNPVTAKMMPDLIASLVPEGVTITLSPPGAPDSWAQFYKNMTGIQMIAFVILFSGVMATELARGTLVMMLTKGLSRRVVILSKLAALAAVWTAAYILCFAVTYAYTVYLLPGELPHTFFAALCLWLFGLMIIAVMLFGGVWFGTVYGALLAAGGFAAALALLDLFPKLQKFNPYFLASRNMSLLGGALEPSGFAAAICSTVLLMAFFAGMSVLLFERKRI